MPKLGATHIRQYPTACCKCGRRAFGELMNSYNAPMGPYCKKCADKKIAEDQK